MLSFGAKIKYFRKKYNHTQKQLGRLCGISGKAISRYENETSAPDIFMLKKIAEIYDTDLNYLAGISSKVNNKFDLELSGIELDLIMWYRKIPKKMQKIIKKIIRVSFQDDTISYSDQSEVSPCVNENKDDEK
ncbi:helix-turn-helix domain-containing protein [Anaerorhabdus sp.]|uniref:helix-turn-helix domain-containing protein n=1 Tax=Anaerorhabdus sp. TaxID=1872524 RepID=UPI002FC9E666